MGCAGLMDREDTKPVTKYKSPRGIKANQRKGSMAVLPIAKRLPDWEQPSCCFCSMMSMCFCLGFKALCEGKPTATPHKLFSPVISTPVWFVICPAQATDSHPCSPSYPTPLPIPLILQQISMQNSDLLLPKTGSRAPSLQQFLRTKFYGLKHKHSQVPCQFSHSSLHYSQAI